MSMPRRVRWRSRLAASGETLSGDGEASSEESDSAAGVERVVDASTAGVASAAAGGAAGVDLTKGIAFEAPKPKALEPQEDESDSKKVQRSNDSPVEGGSRCSDLLSTAVDKQWHHGHRFGKMWLLTLKSVGHGRKSTISLAGSKYSSAVMNWSITDESLFLRYKLD